LPVRNTAQKYVAAARRAAMRARAWSAPSRPSLWTRLRTPAARRLALRLLTRLPRSRASPFALTSGQAEAPHVPQQVVQGAPAGDQEGRPRALREHEGGAFARVAAARLRSQRAKERACRPARCCCVTHRACAHTLDPAPRHPRMLRRSIARAAPQMDQKFLKCRRYSKHGSSVAVAEKLAASGGGISKKKMHPLARARLAAASKK